MVNAKIADLKNNLSRYLAHVRRGGEITVLDRDTPVARIVPFAPRERVARGATKMSGDDYWTPERLAAMDRDGVIRRGDPQAVAEWLQTHPPVKLPAGTPSAVAVLLQMRRESTR